MGDGVMTTSLPASPGIALQMLLRSAKPSVLREIIGPSIVETIEALDPTITSSGRLGDVAAQMVDPATVLRGVSTRARIIGALPLPKARELAQRVGVEDSRNLYADLCEKIADDAFLPLLFSFFGVVEDDRAPTAEASDLAKAAAGYGLFAHQRVAAKRGVSVIRMPRIATINSDFLGFRFRVGLLLDRHGQHALVERRLDLLRIDVRT